MSDSDGLASVGPAGPGQRIGDPERAAVTVALDAHRASGRLSAEEYEDRQVAVAQARTWADVQVQFTDLPAPYPTGMPPLPSPGQQLAASMQPAPVQAGLLAAVVPERYRATVMALTPFAALLLFFSGLPGGWLWFLAIPIMGVLLYGPDGKDARKRDRQRGRDH
jgi:Domain of unknown function (DUF1707)